MYQSRQRTSRAQAQFEALRFARQRHDGVLLKLTITGAQLLKIFNYVMVPENRHDDGQVYQVSQGVRAVYNDAQRKLESLTLNGQAVQDDGRYSVCLSEYHYKNSVQAFNLTDEELTALGKPQVVATSTQDVLEEYLGSHQHLNRQIEGRLVDK